MRPSSTAALAVLLLFGSACGDRVVVARSVSLVSAAVVSSIDGGLPEEDAGGELAEPEFEHGHAGAGGTGGAANHRPPPFPPSKQQSESHEPSGTGGGSGSSKHR